MGRGGGGGGGGGVHMGVHRGVRASAVGRIRHGIAALYHARYSGTGADIPCLEMQRVYGEETSWEGKEGRPFIRPSLYRGPHSAVPLHGAVSAVSGTCWWRLSGSRARLRPALRPPHPRPLPPAPFPRHPSPIPALHAPSDSEHAALRDSGRMSASPPGLPVQPTHPGRHSRGPPLRPSGSEPFASPRPFGARGRESAY